MQTDAMTRVGESAPPETHRLAARHRVARRAELLGWFSLGLGLTQLLAPRMIAWLAGSRSRRNTRRAVRLLGARELASGLGILGHRHPGWVWGRVIGDVMDLALLGRSAAMNPRARARLAGVTAAVLGVTWLDARTAREFSRRGNPKWRAPDRATHVDAVVTIGRSRQEVYAYFRDFKNLPNFMSYLESVEVYDGQARFRARATAGIELEWDAEIVYDRPGEAIAWRSLQGAQLPNRGQVSFRNAPGNRGTEVHVELTFEPSGGRVGSAVGKFLGKLPELKLGNDLRRLKQLLETGEVVKSDASVHAGIHPAQPSASTPAPVKQVQP